MSQFVSRTGTRRRALAFALGGGFTGLAGFAYYCYRYLSNPLHGREVQRFLRLQDSINKLSPDQLSGAIFGAHRDATSELKNRNASDVESFVKIDLKLADLIAQFIDLSEPEASTNFRAVIDRIFALQTSLPLVKQESVARLSAAIALEACHKSETSDDSKIDILNQILKKVLNPEFKACLDIDRQFYATFIEFAAGEFLTLNLPNLAVPLFHKALTLTERGCKAVKLMSDLSAAIYELSLRNSDSSARTTQSGEAERWSIRALDLRKRLQQTSLSEEQLLECNQSYIAALYNLGTIRVNTGRKDGSELIKQAQEAAFKSQLEVPSSDMNERN